jgi:hypothetical protein
MRVVCVRVCLYACMRELFTKDRTSCPTDDAAIELYHRQDGCRRVRVQIIELLLGFFIDVDVQFAIITANAGKPDGGE